MTKAHACQTMCWADLPPSGRCRQATPRAVDEAVRRPLEKLWHREGHLSLNAAQDSCKAYPVEPSMAFTESREFSDVLET